MRIINFEIKEFAKFLVELRLAGKESRMRTRFVKLLADRMKQIEDEREELINQFVEKDEKDQPVTVKNGKDQHVYLMKDADAYNREYIVLMREEFVITHTEDRIEMLRAVRDIVLNADLEFEGSAAFDYDRWCEICEEVEG